MRDVVVALAAWGVWTLFSWIASRFSRDVLRREDQLVRLRGDFEVGLVEVVGHGA